MIEFECPHCSHKIKAQLNAAGISSKCPRCKANVTVPMPESSEPVFDGPSDYSALFEDQKPSRSIDPRIKAAAKTGAEKVGRIAKLTLYVGGGGFAFLVLMAVLMNLANPDAAIKEKAERLEKEVVELRAENRKLMDALTSFKLPVKANDAGYTIIKDEAFGDVKRSVDVRLQKKISKEELKKLALKLKGQGARNFKRTFITYYLPGMQVGNGAWASTHFNPNLNVQIMDFNSL